MAALAELQSAKKRAISMGQFHAWRPEFNAHSLAAAMDNYTACIDGAADDYPAIMGYLLAQARRINAVCDAQRIVGDAAGEYWLERFLWRCDAVANVDRLQPTLAPQGHEG